MRQPRAWRRLRQHVAAVAFAKFGGLGTGDENLQALNRATRGGELQGFRIDFDFGDALRGVKIVQSVVRRERGGPLHELSPYGGGGGRSREVEVAVIVE